MLAAQMKRAADSIALNIAEGSTGQSNAGFKQFVGYAIRSTIEVVSCLYVGRERGIVKPSLFQELYTEAEHIVMMPQALRKSLD